MIRRLRTHLVAGAPSAARGRLCAAPAVAADLGVLAVTRVQRGGGPTGAVPAPPPDAGPRHHGLQLHLRMVQHGGRVLRLEVIAFLSTLPTHGDSISLPREMRYLQAHSTALTPKSHVQTTSSPRSPRVVLVVRKKHRIYRRTMLVN